MQINDSLIGDQPFYIKQIMYIYFLVHMQIQLDN